MSKQTYRVCCCFSRRFRQKEAETPAEIKALFENYSENGTVMTAENLHKFLHEVQGEDKLTLEDAQSVMESLHRHHNIFHRKTLHLQHLFHYLFTDDNSPLQSPTKVYQDMNSPLSHYFIYTGHNSYLTGNQISSDSSDLPIIDALKRGVRVIELDMWPNSTKDDIHILHGGTLTNPVALIKCLRSIRDYAFVASEYPVILTLEDHLTPDLQAKVAQMVTETFGDILVSTTSESLSQFPSPESLKRRVILSTKPPKEYLETKNQDSGIKKSSEEAAWGKELSDIAHKFKVNDDIKNEELEHGEYEEEDENHNLQQNIATEYKQLIAIRAEKMKGGIKAWLRVDSQKAHRVSLNEEKLENAVKTHGTDIVRFTQRNLMRVYPKASRIDSSNFNPLIGWMHGAQMVAFNMQGHGRPLWLMQGMFRANCGCGYVKKPDFLLTGGQDTEVFDPNRHLPMKKILKVKVYMGEGWDRDFKSTHFDLYSPPDFYVKVGIAGVVADTSVNKTKVVEDNWFPSWNEEFEFPLTVPELALLRVEVHEFDMSERDDFGGQTCLPIPELKTGIRAVPLYDYKGNKYKSVKLLMRFDFL